MKLFVYGDSVCAPDHAEFAPGWVKILSNKLKCEYINYAKSGGSTEYAFYKFTTDLTKNKFEDDDVIIFQFSTTGRLFFKHQMEHPGTASLYLPNSVGLPLSKKTHKWYHENKEFIEWYILNVCDDITEINQLSYRHVLKDFAADNPKNKVIILELGRKNFYFPMPNKPENFYCPNIDLMSIIQEEILGKLEYTEWVKYTGWDMRINHLSIPNLNSLANIIFGIIKTGSVEENYSNYFIKNCFMQIKSEQDFQYYVNQGLLYNRDFLPFNLSEIG
jgi:hypothetical protein